MGRNAGWLTAASALSRVNGGEGPNLIYLCEPAFDTEQFLKDVQEKLEQKDSVLVAISEGIHDSEGRYVSEQVQSDAQDQFGHSYIAGSAKVLEELVRDRIGCKVRSIELNLMQRCSSHLASFQDLEEGFAIGQESVAAALRGESGKMVAVQRLSNTPYAIRLNTVEVADVANREQLVPEKWGDLEDAGGQAEVCRYILPLIKGEVPQFKNEFGLNDYIIFE